MPGVPPLGRETNMADVARRAGVSIATVSRALRDLPGVRPATRDRVRSVADELAYVVSPEASRLGRRETGRIAVVVPRIDIWFYAAMLSGIARVLREADVDVLVYQVDGMAERSRFFRDLPSRRKVDVVILVALPMLDDEIDRLDLMGVEVVVAGGRLLGRPHVEVDDLETARQAVEHLIGLGHRRIAMLRTSDTDRTTWSSDVARTGAFHETLREHGIADRAEYVVTMPFGTRAGAEGMERLLALDEPPTAVFAYSDEIAISALTTLRRRGVAVPQQLSLIGVDGHPLGEIFELSTVSQRVSTQARRAGELALGLLRGEVPERTVRVACELVLRGSTAPPCG